MTQRQNSTSGNSDTINSSNAPSRGGGAPVSPQAAGTKAVQIQAMSAEERRSTQRLQAEIQSLRKETELAMQSSADLQEQNDELAAKLHELGVQKDAEIAQVSEELLKANAQIDELQEEIVHLQAVSSPRKAESPRKTVDTIGSPAHIRPVCRKCEAEIEEPLCAECFTSLLPKSNADEASVPAPPSAKPSGASRLAMKARMLSRFALQAPKPVTLQGPLPGEMDTKELQRESAPQKQLTPATASPQAAPMPGVIKKKQWSYEKDIEQWKEHCDKLIAREREDCKARINEKSADIVELFEISFEGRKHIYAQLLDMER